MQHLKSVLLVILALVGCCVLAQQPTNPANPGQQDWEARVRASVDNQKQARGVILDAIYARKAEKVAAFYEKAYNEKPASDVRFANFVYAAAVSECNRQRHEDHEYKPVFDRAFKALGEAGFPERGGQAQGRAAGPLGKMANAWLAWGHILIRFGFDRTGSIACYKQALKLDPNMAEAYFWWAEEAIEPHQKPYYDAHAKTALLQLDRAEQLEPKMHPLVLREKAYLLMGAGTNRENYKKVVPMLKEFLRLWPEVPTANITREHIAGLEKFLAAK